MKKYIAMLLGLLVSWGSIDAQSRSERLKPQWLKVPPVCKDDRNIFFVPVTVEMPNADYQNIVRRKIYTSLPVSWRQGVTYSDDQKQDLNPVMENGKAVRKGGANIHSESIMTADGSIIRYKSMVVDEYVSRSAGREEYSVLYQVIPEEGTAFRECLVSDKYGFGGTVLSLVPGVGQFYKGDALKGGIFMGGCVLGGVGIVLSEMQRQAYISQIGQTHDINVIRQLDAKQKNMGITRNVCIGVTAALYIWNLFDAAIAPGAKRVKVTERGIQYNF